MSSPVEQKFYDDPKYRSYASHIEKALRNFEYSTEWADLISALVKLNKVLQSNTSFEILPKRITIGKRLSQCLHPALPGGVHIKALEVYDTIFKIIGKKRLELDLHIYGTGIYSLLVNASMQVRPVLLNVYETHLLPLGEELRSSLDGMLLGLLPGLEEGSEHFDRITLLLDKISKSVGLQYFYSSLWRCILSSPSGSIIRLAATQLILRQFDKKKMTDDQLHLFGLDVDAMIHALCEALQDDNVLTQRATLDVLGYCFPMSALPVSRSDIQQIMSSAVNILLRRDMSLNRRLYSWLLGTDMVTSSDKKSKNSGNQYFEKNSQEILTCAILEMIYTHNDAFKSSCCANTVLRNSGLEAKLLRIIISLLDKAEIGPVILNDIFGGILRLIDTISRKYKEVLSAHFKCKKCNTTSAIKDTCSRAQSEFIKLVNLFVNTFESDYIWNVLCEGFSNACMEDQELSGEGQSAPVKTSFKISEICGVIETMIRIVSMETYVEIQTLYLPELLNGILKQLIANCDKFSEENIAICLKLSIEILKHVQPVQPTTTENNNTNLENEGIESCVKTFQDFIVAFISSKIVLDKECIDEFCEDFQNLKGKDLRVLTGYEVVLRQKLVSNKKLLIQFQNHGQSNDTMLQAFQDSCKLLVDLCCFPLFSLPRRTKSGHVLLEESGLPQWLLCLIACACSYNTDTLSYMLADERVLDYFYSIRMTACSTILELMAVTLTSYEKSSSVSIQESQRSVVSVVVPSPLLTSNVTCLFEKTNFYERVGKILWSELGDVSLVSNSCSKIWSVSRMLILLHQLCPDETVERLILQDVLSKDQNFRVIAIKKFAKLWHYAKENAYNTHQSRRNFSRCLFAVLDQLVSDRHAFFPDMVSKDSGDAGQSLVAITVSVWLRHVLESGGIGNILEPYLLISLEGRTHRKSLQNFLRDRRTQDNSNQIEYFLEKLNNDRSDTSCQTCAELQQDIRDDESMLSKYRNLSVDSVLSFALCEVHQQIAKERHSYEHLVGLLTLSDEVQSPVRLKSCSSVSEEDLNTWVLGFVNMVITQGLKIYKSQVESSGEHSILASDNIEELVSEDVILQDENELSDSSTVSHATEAIELNQSFMMNENPLYSHVLVYQEQFDTKCVLYGLQGILDIASAHPRVFVYAACTTSLSSNESVFSNHVQELLVRHERSIEQGKSFYDPTSPSLKGAMKNRMLIEVIISVCLYYLRSAFYDTQDSREAELNHEIHTVASNLLKFMLKELTILAQEDEASNKGTKTLSSTKQFSAYIVLVLQRQQVQSVILTCLLTTIFALKNHGKSFEDGQSISNFSEADAASNFDEEALQFSRSDHLVERYLGTNIFHITTMFSRFLGLIFDLVTLEHYAFSKERKLPAAAISMDDKPAPNIAFKRFPSFTKPKLKRSQRLFSHLLSASHQYDSDMPLASQKVFVSTILEIYRLENQLELHQQCSMGLHTVLPYLGMALSATVVPILLQQCLNIEKVSKLISTKSSTFIPPSYLESTIKSMVTLSHYCLLTDTGVKNSDKSTTDSLQGDTVSLVSAKTTQSSGSSSIGAGLSTLLNVFNSSSSTKSSSVSNEAERSDGLFAAKIAILNNLARIVSCMCLLWKDLVSNTSDSKLPSEEIKAISHNILQLLGPLAIRYGEYLLVAFSLVWQDRESDTSTNEIKSTNSLSSFIKPNSNLEHVIDLMTAIKLLSTEMYFSLVKQVLKSPPPTTNEHKGVTLQESILQMLLYYMRRLKPGVLMENWSGFFPVIQETLTLGALQNTTPNSQNLTSPISPNCYFLLMYLLSEYVKRSHPFAGKKEQRELQEVVNKCVESCNTIAGSSLEQGTWIRRNVSVLPGPQAPEGTLRSHRKTESQSSIDIIDQHPESPTELPIQISSSDTLVANAGHKSLAEAFEESRPASAKERPDSLPQVSKPSLNPVNFRNSVKALTVMSEIVANLLDVVYSSEDKEKVIPILISIMANVTPYLKNHSKDNTPSFCACISFLASISEFQYTRRAWRKDVIDLFLDSPFFHMPLDCLNGWRTIIDNLMTHDKMTFKEVMSRTSLSKPGASTPTLSIFSNKEQELELRALHIKRLAFIVFSSEMDQYQRQLPEIQERLAESLRLNNVPGVQCRVFLCFRVLLLRVSPHSLTSLWPTMFTELVHAMLQLEQALQPSFPEENHKIKPKSKQSKGGSPSTPGDRKTVMTCWLDMYLSACKLLDLALCLPVHYVPQFQLYKWTFIGDATQNSPNGSPMEYHPQNSTGKDKQNGEEDEEPDPTFLPHCVRIQRLFSELYPERQNKLLNIIPEKPLLNITRLKTLDQLQLFFNTITSPTYLLRTQNSSMATKHGVKRAENEALVSLPMVERNIEKDFVRPML